MVDGARRPRATSLDNPWQTPEPYDQPAAEPPAHSLLRMLARASGVSVDPFSLRDSPCKVLEVQVLLRHNFDHAKRLRRRATASRWTCAVQWFELVRQCMSLCRFRVRVGRCPEAPK